MESNILGLSLFAMATLAVLIACIPLLKQAKRNFWVVLVAMLGVGIAYLNWGGYFALSDYQLKQARLREVNQILASPEKTRALIHRMISELDDSPQSAPGWVLIGKLYLVLHQEQEAKRAFEKAAQLRH